MVKVDDVELQRRLGVVGRDPRWAIAWKFPPTTAITRLKGVQWNVGKFGDMHPFAELEPVHVGGVTVKLATLHNEEDIVRKDLRPGEDVIVLRAGDVIPQVLSPAPHVVEHKKRPPIPRPPERCPFCDTETVKVEGEVFTKCPNRDCPERRWQLLKHYVSRGAMDIDGLGEKQVAQLQQAGLVKTPGDYYRLAVEQLTELEGWGQISAERTVANIAASKDRGFGRVLFASASRRSATSPGATSPSSSAPSTRCSPPRPSRSRPRRASGRRWPRRSPSSSPTSRCATLIDDLRARGRRDGARGAAARRGAAGGQDVRPHRHAARPHARAGQRAHRRRRRPGDLERVEEDRLRRGRRERRLQARPRPSRWASPCSTSPGCSGCSMARPRDPRAVGRDPDPRFTLANERTYLAWNRTALALIGGGLAAGQLLDFQSRTARLVVALPPIALGLILALLSYRRWQANERALRLDEPLPGGAPPFLLAAGVAVVGIVIVVVLVVDAAS